jgi:DUF3035 family protein
MFAKRTLVFVALIAMIGLSGCEKSQGVGQLLNLKSKQNGPDEFGILPTKPLEMPEDLTALPEPEPGGRNLADLAPERDIVTAMGGKPAQLDRKTIAVADLALVRAAVRNGVASDIRGSLAAEDLVYRRTNKGKLLERIFNSNVYFGAYTPFTLEAYTELARLRRLGVRTPTAPPQEAGN